MNSDLTELFGHRISYPDPDIKERLSRLVGLDDHKERLTKILGILINPTGLQSWIKKHHPNANGLMHLIMSRPPLIILEGDVGSGKSELAETIGDAVARREKIDVTLFPLSLSSRGQGRVGEMTQLLSSAFDYVIAESKKLKSVSGKARGAIIFLVDEADALAQSRESTQMHHEDRAGVNAFIRGVDLVAKNKLPMAIIMCTNRLGALDPAIRRRSADIMSFSRPNKLQRYEVLREPLEQLGFTKQQIDQIANATGNSNGRSYGYTFSDIVHRLIPMIVLDSYPEKSVDPDRALDLALNVNPTPPFQEGDS